MIRPTKICVRTFTRNTAIAIIIIINNTITQKITVPIVPVIPMFTLDVQALDHITEITYYGAHIYKVSDKSRLNYFYIIKEICSIIFQIV